MIPSASDPADWQARRRWASCDPQAEYELIGLRGVEEGKFRVVAELVEVLV